MTTAQGTEAAHDFGPGEGLAPLAVPAARAAGCPFDPAPGVERARREEPVTRATLWDGSSCWLVTRHQDVREVLGDPRFSADASRPGFPFLTAGARELATSTPTFIRRDDPEHARLRRMLTADFMVKKVEAMRPEVQRLADESARPDDHGAQLGGSGGRVRAAAAVPGDLPAARRPV